MLMLDKRGAVLDTARTLSRLFHDHNLRGAVIGGVAVVLHGHVRTTRDVDILAHDSTDQFAEALRNAGATFDRAKKEFTVEGIPVHLVPKEMAKPGTGEPIEIEGITTVDLRDLINLKLTTGMQSVLRAQDIADVIGLIRANNLRATYAGQLHKSVRAEFRKLVKAVRSG
jgi:hypothetical protein